MKTKAPRRKTSRPRQGASNPIALAMRRAAKIPQTEVDEVMRHVLAAFQAMREGVGSEDDWCVLASSVELGLAIEKGGVIRGLQGHLANAETALAEIGKRARAGGEWRATPLYYQEIENLDAFTWLHREQLEALSEGEWRKAHQLAVGRVRAAGGTVLAHVQDLDRQQPLPLAS